MPSSAWQSQVANPDTLTASVGLDCPMLVLCGPRYPTLILARAQWGLGLLRSVILVRNVSRPVRYILSLLKAYIEALRFQGRADPAGAAGAQPHVRWARASGRIVRGVRC